VRPVSSHVKLSFPLHSGDGHAEPDAERSELANRLVAADWKDSLALHLMMPTTTNTTICTMRHRRRRRRKRRRRIIHSGSLLCTPRDRRIRAFQSLTKLWQRATSPSTIQGRPSGSGISKRVSPHPCKASIAHVPALLQAVGAAGWPQNQASERIVDSSLSIHQPPCNPVARKVSLTVVLGGGGGMGPGGTETGMEEVSNKTILQNELPKLLACCCRFFLLDSCHQ
jgi:hypothetical protein